MSCPVFKTKIQHKIEAMRAKDSGPGHLFSSVKQLTTALSAPAGGRAHPAHSPEPAGLASAGAGGGTGDH